MRGGTAAEVLSLSVNMAVFRCKEVRTKAEQWL
jgi:hypothetical protein